MLSAGLSRLPIPCDCQDFGYFRSAEFDTFVIQGAAEFLLLCPQIASVGAIEVKMEQEFDPDFRTDQRLDQEGEIEWIVYQI